MIQIQNTIEPFFSVIITTYNRAQLLPRAVDSLIAQTEHDWEAIIVDDGSSDNTYVLCKEYCLKHQNIRYLFQSNRGTPAARNTGIRVSAGEFVTFLDSDDEYKPEHLEIRKQYLTEIPGLELLYGGVEIIGNPYVPDINDTRELIHLDECEVGGTFFIKRSSAIGIGGFPPVRYGDDTGFFEIALKNDLKICKTDINTYIYHRDTPDSICNNINQYKSPL